MFLNFHKWKQKRNNKIKMRKITVNQARIKRMLAAGINITKVAYTCGVPRTVVERIITGKDVPFYTPKPKSKGTDPNNGICTCCGRRRIANGNRYLCEWCFSHCNNNDGIYPVTTVNTKFEGR